MTKLKRLMTELDIGNMVTINFFHRLAFDYL